LIVTAAELQQGSGFCEIDAGEVAAAGVGLASLWPLIRDHARVLLEEWEEREAGGGEALRKLTALDRENLSERARNIAAGRSRIFCRI